MGRNTGQILAICHLLRNPAPDQNPMCDISDLIIGNYKTLPGWPHVEKLPFPHHTWCTAKALQFSSGSFSQGKPSFSPPQPVTLMHISVFLTQMPPLRALCSGLSPLQLSTFPFLSLPSLYLPLAQRSIKRQEPSVSVFLTLRWFPSHVLHSPENVLKYVH